MNDLDQWFLDEVLPHEADLTRFIRRFTQDAIEDVRQDAYVRIYDAARSRRPEHARSFLFSITRNLLIDRARRAATLSASRMADNSSMFVIPDDVPVDKALSDKQQLDRLLAAIDRLPPRCREVVILRRVEGMRLKDIAVKMGTAVDTVDKQLAKGIRLIAEWFDDEDDSSDTVTPFRRESRRGRR